MGRTIRRRMRVAIDFSKLTDDKRHSLVAAVKTAAPNSAIYTGSQAVQAVVSSCTTKSDDLKKANTQVQTDRGKLASDLSDETEKRDSLDADVHTLITLTRNGATKPSDVTGMGLPYEDPAPRPNNGPEPPSGINPSFPARGHGKAWATAVYTGKGHPQFNAEQSLDGTTWTALVGHGKRRTILAPSGTKVWVRFCTVRGEVASDWSAPVIITIP